MKPESRRSFLRTSITATAAFSMPRLVIAAEGAAKPADANNTVRVGVIGMGDTTAVGGVGGRGHQLIPRIREVPGVKITALCDVDQTFLDREAQPFKDRGESTTTYRDLRKLFDDKTIDAVVIALPNHWHALATIWACQSGKDVYVEKPFSYNLWEGRQMVAAARKYGRIVQVGTQNRSSTSLPRAFDTMRSELGAIRLAHAIIYRARAGIGTVTAPTAVPAGVDYDLWCGPAAKSPLKRKQLHYEWHWFWETGNGEIGNNGVHIMDLCRWALGQNAVPPRAISIAGRFAFNDGGETPNTHLALLDYQPAPLLCEVRNISAPAGRDTIGRFRGQNRGLVIDCEGGHFAGDASGGALFDPNGKKIKDLPDDGSSKRLETLHLVNFFAAVRSRKTSDLVAEAAQGHYSAACCHLPNVSHRLGRQSSPESIRERIKANPEFAAAFDRCAEYLRTNGVDLAATPAVLGPWITYDNKREQFTGESAKEASMLSRRQDRAPFVVPAVV